MKYGITTLTIRYIELQGMGYGAGLTQVGKFIN